MSDWSKLLEKLNSEQLGTNTIFQQPSNMYLLQSYLPTTVLELLHTTVSLNCKKQPKPDTMQLLFATRLLDTSWCRKAIYNIIFVLYSSPRKYWPTRNAAY